jgi:hypothetical protein
MGPAATPHRRGSARPHAGSLWAAAPPFRWPSLLKWAPRQGPQKELAVVRMGAAVRLPSLWHEPPGKAPLEGSGRPHEGSLCAPADGSVAPALAWTPRQGPAAGRGAGPSDGTCDDLRLMPGMSSAGRCASARNRSSSGASRIKEQARSGTGANGGLDRGRPKDCPFTPALDTTSVPWRLRPGDEHDASCAEIEP